MLSIKHGGVREDAYTDDINLAYRLEDGMKIHIPTKQEKVHQKVQKILKSILIQLHKHNWKLCQELVLLQQLKFLLIERKRESLRRLKILKRLVVLEMLSLRKLKIILQ